jgi:NAD(P)-dependent dehydrogenase (short-subunit alcohol dehydrogenase family)
MVADLCGTAALITGAASGIGRASALAFGSAGASVALVDIDAEGLAAAAATARAVGPRAEVLVADVRDLRAVTAAVASAVEAFGRLDATLNNAGVPGPYVPLDEYSEEDFMQILRWTWPAYGGACGPRSGICVASGPAPLSIRPRCSAPPR